MRRTLILASLFLLTLPACRQNPEPVPAAPEYSRPLPPGAHALRRLNRAAWPDLNPVVDQMADPGFNEALARSLRWFRAPSTQQFFPLGSISHAHAWASVYAVQELAKLPPNQRYTALEREFDVWQSVGWDGAGTVLYTGYYSPVFDASRTRNAQFSYPLYRRPADLVADPKTGEVLGRRVNDTLTAYPTRRQIEADPASFGLAGRELVWLASKLDAYIIQVNGSARLRLRDGTTMDIGFAGTNGAEYTSIGQLLIQDGKLSADTLSLPTLRNYFQLNPQDLDHYTHQNDRYVFFQEYGPGTWPAGSLGFQVTPMRTLATDKAIYPRGGVVFVQTTLSPASGTTRTFHQLMMDQDTGGAIRAPGRADLYIGTGAPAEGLAGRQAAEGQLFYLFLKPERVLDWYGQMQGSP